MAQMKLTGELKNLGSQVFHDGCHINSCLSANTNVIGVLVSQESMAGCCQYHWRDWYDGKHQEELQTRVVNDSPVDTAHRKLFREV